jgi:MOSC domain-containing protein YiiM
MKVLSVNVSMPRTITHQGRQVSTGIFKEPVAGRVRIRGTGLEGDGQADPDVHGGADKAVYAYCFEHYAYWEKRLGRDDLVHGQFGENLTVEGMVEHEVHIGDRFRIGDALLEVSQPRTPCFKLAIRMGIPDFSATFLRSCRVGFYLRVLEEGEVGAGDTMERTHVDPARLTVRDACRLRFLELDDRAAARRAMAVEALPSGWRRAFAKLAGQG